ncbi:MAG: 1-acyl-sn-glycerol-3-phosphate acyltransferase [Acidimicrobiia bacterium]|nr:1-acyl-sn-glycerol-3-phosphate acyltransferase [Acidimicrobiia bacterium]
MSVFYSMMGPFVSAVWERYFDESVSGLEHIPADGPLIVASNHISHLDPLTLCQVFWKNRPRRQLSFLAKQELFERQPLASVMRMGGQIPVARGTTAAKDSLSFARAALAAGRTVVVFPEGTVSVLFVPMRPHSGVGRLALETGVGVLPMGVWGTHRSMAKYRGRDIEPHRAVTIDIGAVRRYAPGDASASEVAADIMQAVIELVVSARARYPEAAAPGEWWGPPEWPAARAGRWRPKLDKSLSPEEALSVAQRALDEA